MTRNIALSRPATSAIAAFLVLSTPVAFAQEAPAVNPTVTMTPPVAAPTLQTPPTVAAPTATTPVVTPQATEPLAPKPVIRVPLDIAPAETAPAAETAERAAPAPKRAERVAPRPKAAAAVAAPASAAPLASASDIAPPTALAGSSAPIAAPVSGPVEPVADPVPLPAEKAATTGSDTPWELVGGAAALLLVGGAGLIFARRRRVERAVAEDAPVYEQEPVTASAPGSEAKSWVTPAYAPREDAAPRMVPAFAAAPSGSMGRHEAMAIAGPTPENPFATLNKRLKRARFLDRQERIAYEETLGQQKDPARKPVSAWEISQRPAAPAVQKQEVRRPEPARGRPDLRPGFARN